MTACVPARAVSVDQRLTTQTLILTRNEKMTPSSYTTIQAFGLSEFWEAVFACTVWLNWM